MKKKKLKSLKRLGKYLGICYLVATLVAGPGLMVDITGDSKWFYSYFFTIPILVALFLWVLSDLPKLPPDSHFDRD